MLVLYLQMLDEPQQRASFEQFYRRYRQDMFAVAFGILHSKQDAEDAVSQAFFSIAKSFEKITHLDCHEMKAYAVIVCRNKSLNIYKQNKRRAEQTAELDSELLQEKDFESQTFSELDQAVAALDGRYKDVITLYYYYGFSAQEVAELLGVHVDTVRHRAMRAKRLLKQALEKGEGND